ncbi:MAG: hypothetical protein ACFE0J_25500 [Elainellaceae cyanobacterium]
MTRPEFLILRVLKILVKLIYDLELPDTLEICCERSPLIAIG